jgi:hypothetical protein
MDVEFTPIQMGVVSAALHLLSHHPILHEEDSKELRRYVFDMREDLFKLVEEARQNGELPSDFFEVEAVEQEAYKFARLLSDCLYCELVWDSFETFQELSMRHGQWALEKVMEERAGMEGVMGVMRADDDDDDELPDIDDT